MLPNDIQNRGPWDPWQPTENQIRANWGLPLLDEDVAHQRIITPPPPPAPDDWGVLYHEVDIESLLSDENLPPSPLLNEVLAEESELSDNDEN